MQTKFLVKYTNRKIYDPETSKYVSLPEISEFIKNGLEVKVLEYKTDKDITRYVKLQIIASFQCQKRGHTENADLNAAKVILARGHRVLACGEDVIEATSVVNNNSSKNRKRKEARTSKTGGRNAA